MLSVRVALRGQQHSVDERRKVGVVSGGEGIGKGSKAVRGRLAHCESFPRRLKDTRPGDGNLYLSLSGLQVYGSNQSLEHLCLIALGHWGWPLDPSCFFSPGVFSVSLAAGSLDISETRMSGDGAFTCSTSAWPVLTYSMIPDPIAASTSTIKPIMLSLWFT